MAAARRARPWRDSERVRQARGVRANDGRHGVARGIRDDHAVVQPRRVTERVDLGAAARTPHCGAERVRPPRVHARVAVVLVARVGNGEEERGCGHRGV